MASHQQDHNDDVDQLKVCGCCKGIVNSLMEENKKLKAKLFEIKKCSSTKVLEEKLEKMECSLIKKVQEILLNRPRSALPSNASLLPHQAETSASTSYQLCVNYEGKFPDTFYTKNNIEYLVPSLKVELCDHIGKRVEVGPESCFKDVKVKFLVLDGDLKDDFTVEDFNRYIAEPRKDREALLKDNCEVSLSNGSARVCGFSFTDNSKSMRNGKFRLGAQLTSGDHFGGIVRPAVSPPFRVKENRTQDDQKRPTPSPTDALYRLKHIRKNGPYHQRALEIEVATVIDFLQLNNTDPVNLKTILDVKGAKWKEIVENAKNCDLTSECYKLKYHDEASGDVLHLKCDFEIESVTFKGQTSQPYESLDNSQKEKAGMLRKAAYKKRKELEKVNDNSTYQTRVQSGLEYLPSVEQPEHGELEEQPARAPAPAASGIHPNVPYAVGLQAQMCINPEAYHDNCQQDFMMNPSASLTANAYGVQHTAMEAVFHGASSSVAHENLTEQFAYGLQGDMNIMQPVSDTAIYAEGMMSSPFLNWFNNLGNDTDEENNPLFSDELWNVSPANMMPSSTNIGVEHKHSWCITRVILWVIWLRRGAIHRRPQKKPKYTQ